MLVWCPTILVAISAPTTLQAGSLLSSNSSSLQTTDFSPFFFFNMKFMAANVLPPARWGRKKSKGERINIYSMFIFSKSMLQSGELRCVCVCIVCERILSGTAAGKILEDQGTVFSDKLSSGKLQLYCRKWYLRPQLICESQERKITDSSSGLQNLIYKNLGLSRRLCLNVICISILSPPQPLNLPAALPQWKFLFSVCSKYILKNKKSWYNGSQLLMGKNVAFMLKLFHKTPLPSASFIILWGIESPDTIFRDFMWCLSLSFHLHKHHSPFNFYLPRSRTTLHYLVFVRSFSVWRIHNK